MTTDTPFKYFEPNQLDFNNEDLTVAIHLEVEVPSRGSFETSTYTGDMTFNTTPLNMLQGDGTVLTTSYSDISMMDIRNGGNVESIGIESINIKYSSNYFPEVDIKFVDVRGNSVFNPMEETNNKDKDGKSLGRGSFLSCFFMFPYPIFKLTVKGYFGKPVQYKLTVRDVRSRFNAETGNFEINVAFIGYNYFYLTDIPMQYLLIAPYVEYGGLTKHSEENPVLGYIDGKPIISFIDLVEKTGEALKGTILDEGKKTDTSGLQEATVKHRRFIELKKSGEDLLKYLNEHFDITPNDYKTDRRLDSITIKLKETDENGNVISINNHHGDGINGINEILKNNINNIINKVDNLSLMETEKDELEKDFTIYSKYKYNQDNRNCIIKNNENPYEQVNFHFNVCYFFEKLNNYIGELEEKITDLQGNIEKTTTTALEKVLGYAPTIENIFKTTIAHLDRFWALMEKCNDNINVNKNNRKITNFVNFETDCHTNGKEITIPPFPGFYDKNKRTHTWIGEVPQARAFDEIGLVNSISKTLNDAVKEANDVIQTFEDISKTAATFTPFIPTILYDIKYYENPYGAHEDDGHVKWKVKDKNDFEIPDVLNIFLRRLFVNLYFYGSHNIEEGYRTYIESIDCFSKIEAHNCFNSVINKKVLVEDEQYWVGSAVLDPYSKAYTKFKTLQNDITVENISPFETEVCIEEGYANTYFKGEGRVKISPILDKEIGTGRKITNSVSANINIEYRCGSAQNDWGFAGEHAAEGFTLTKTELNNYNELVRAITTELTSIPEIKPEDQTAYFKIFNERGKISEIDASIFKENSEEKNGFVKTEKYGDITEDALDDLDIVYRIGETYAMIESALTDISWIDDIKCLYPIYEDNNDNFDNIFGSCTYWDNRLTVEAFSEDKENYAKIRDVAGVGSTVEINKKWFFKEFFRNIGLLPNLNFSASSKGKIPLSGILAFGLYNQDKLPTTDMQMAYDENIEFFTNSFYDIFIKKSPQGYVKKGNYVIYHWGQDKKDFLKKLFSTENYVEDYQLYPNILRNFKTLKYNKQLKKSGTEPILTANDFSSNITGFNDEQTIKQYIKSFMRAMCDEILKFKNGQETINISGNNEDSLSVDRKLGIYSSLKNLYDRWKFGVKIENGGETQLSIDNFVFRNSLNEDVGKKLTINLEKLSKNIISFYRNENEINVYSFLTNICGFVDAIMLSLPVNIYETMKDEQGIRELFKPHNSLNMSKERMKTTYVITHVQKPSQYLNMGGNSNGYEDDGIDFTNKHVCSGYSGGSIGVFGVTYSMGDQKYFKNIDVSMENPKVTEQSISSLLYIAEKAPQNNTSKLHRSYHDLFDTYSTHSYDCTVETMGNAQLMPMMYFQLNNIPLFKGGYLITSVEHSINRNGMNTTFIGNRVNKYQFDLSNSGIDNVPKFTNLNDADGNSVVGSKRVGTSNKYGESLKGENLNIGKDITKLDYKQDTTLIVIDVGHRRGTVGKESPELQYPLGEEGEDNTTLFNTINGVSERDHYNNETMSDGSTYSNVLSPYRKESDTEIYKYREYWGNRLIADELKTLLRNKGYLVEIATNTGSEKYDRSDDIQAFYWTHYNELYNNIINSGGSGINHEVVTKNGKKETKNIKSMIVISIHSNAAANSLRIMNERDENGNILHSDNPKKVNIATWENKTNFWEIYAQKAEWDAKRGLMFYAYHPETSKKLAECIREGVMNKLSEMKESGLPENTKVKEVQYFENRDGGILPTTHTFAPTVLSENFFHNNSDHVKFLAKKENRKLIAEAHYNGIVKFLGGATT